MNKEARQAFLDRVRAAVKRGVGQEAPAPSEQQYSQTRLVAEGANCDEVAGRFIELAQEAGMAVHRVKGEAGLASKVVELAGELGLKRILLSEDAARSYGAVAKALAESETIEVVSPPEEREALAAAAFEADGGITVARAAVAETGSLLLAASAAEARLVSLAAPIHLCVLRAADVVGDLWDVTERLGEASAVTLVSGPSKTADIEMTLVTGVHGPTAEHVLLVE